MTKQILIWMIIGLAFANTASAQLDSAEDDIDVWHAERLERLGGKARPYKHPGKQFRNEVYKQIGDWYGLFDLYMPQEVYDDPVPLVVYFHGGGWGNGSKENVIPVAWREPSILTELTQRGIAVASVDYRLCKFDLQKTVIRDCVTDCKDAIRFMAKHSAKYQIDANQMAVIGGSAGGHLAQMVTLTPPESFPGDRGLAKVTVNLRGGVSSFGPSDFESHKSFGLSSEKAYHRRWLNRLFVDGASAEAIAKLEAEISPVLCLKPDSPPVLFVHGDSDRTISYRQMELMQKRARELNAPMQFVTVKHSGHGWKQENPDREIDPSYEEIVSMQVSFFERILKNEQGVK